MVQSRWEGTGRAPRAIEAVVAIDDVELEWK